MGKEKERKRVESQRERKEGKRGKDMREIYQGREEEKECRD